MAGTATTDPADLPPRSPTVDSVGRRAWRFVRSALLPALAVAAAVHPVATLLARWDWHADVLTSFGLPAQAITLLALIVSLQRRRFLLAGPLLGLAVFQITPLVPLYRPSSIGPDPTRPERLRILSVNVLETNANYAAVAALIRRERPDIVGLIEMTPEWMAGLAATGVDRDYPYRQDWPFGGMGMSLWVRGDRPRPELLAGATGFSPAMVARLDWAGQRRTVWLVHPMNPFYAGAGSLTEIDALGRAIARERGRAEHVASSDSTIVFGDLNRTDGSPHFGRFLDQARLRDTRLGFGPQPSWPAWLHYRIAIDHAFVSDDLAVTDRRLGPRVGSDHLPLIVELAPAATKLAAHAAQAPP
jgi:endonuclease/exonuclease/phosphatase (EEP) superfamily protein YafD